MAKVPGSVTTHLRDCRGELERLSTLAQQLTMKQKDRHSPEAQVFYSISTVCLDLVGAMEILVDHLDKQK